MKQTYPSWPSRWVLRPLAALGLLLATAGAAQAQPRALVKTTAQQADPAYPAAQARPVSATVTTYQPLGTRAQTRQQQAAVSSAVPTTTVTFANSQQGWFSPQRGHTAGNNNYIVGSSALNATYHNFFTFPLTSLDLTGKQVVGATLSVVDNGLAPGTTSTVTYVLHDVSTPAATLGTTYAASDPVTTSVYDDLGTGQTYGSYTGTTAVTGGRRTYVLNAAALADIVARAGQNFTIGGLVLEAQIPADLYLFGSTGVTGNGTNLGQQTLTLELADAQAITTGTVSTAACAGAALSVPFTAAGTFAAGNVFSAQLSDAAGSFAAPVIIGTLAGTSSGTIAATVPAATAGGSGYRVRVVSSNPAVTGTDNGSAITITALPTVTMLSPTSGPTGTSVTITGTSLTGATGVSFNGTAATTFSVVNSTTITATVPTGASSGPVTVTTPCGTSNGVQFTVATTVTAINRVGSSPTNASSVSYTVTFAAAVTGLTASNFALATTGSVAGASITSLSGSGTTYTVTVNTGTGDGTLGLNLTNTTGLSPSVSNVPFAGQVYTIDKTAPTLVITSSTAPNGGNTTTMPFNFVVTFSEDIAGVGLISPVGYSYVTNKAGGSITRTAANITTYTITPAGVGAVTLAIPAGAVTDAAGNSNVGPVSYTIYYGTPTAAPVVTTPANNATTSGRPTFAGTAPAGSAVTVYVNGSSIGTTTATGGSFSLTPATALASGSYSVYATAQLSGGLVSANSNTNTFTVDATAPTATLSTTAGSSTSTSPIPFTVMFSEAVTGFSVGSFTVSNGTVTSGPTSSGSTAYTFQVTPTGNGPVSVSLPANAVQDAVGNGNVASNTASVQYTAPVAASLSVLYQTGDLGQPTDGQLRPFLQLVNAGTTAVPYSTLTVRYWLTVENFMGSLITPIDYAKLGTSFVSARYVQLAAPRQGALGYIEYSFAAGAGSLNPGTDSGPIYGKAYKPDYSDFNETDDWSYQTSGSFTSNSHVTLYQNGTLISGVEPPAVTATTALQVYAASRDASTSTSYISVQLQVRNTGNLPVSYGDVKVRYYFTRDGATTVVPEVDYAKLGNSNVSLRVVNLATPVGGADAYLEVAFAAGLGTLYPRSSTDDILLKLRKDDYSAFDQTNDYSFSAATALALNDRITALVGSTLVFGTPPSGAPARMAATTTLASASVAAASGPLELQLTGSPNPFGEQLTLRFALPTAQAYTLAVYDGRGRLVQQLASGQVEANQAQEVAVPTQAYATGLYLVRLTTAAGVQTRKLVKQ